MTASVTSISTSANASQVSETQINTQPELATVLSVDSLGRIESVALTARDTKQQIIAQAKHITCATENDSVLVQHTLQGLIVIALLASKDDSPAAYLSDRNGHVNVRGAKSVTLSTARGTIEVHENGKIVLDATELSACSERDFTIAGWPIRLN